MKNDDSKIKESDKLYMEEKFDFKESQKKPDLFYKNLDNKIILFLDLRDWNHGYLRQPSFYYQTFKELSKEEKKKYNQIILNEFFTFCKQLHIYARFDELMECDVCNKKFIEKFGFCDWEYNEGGFACSEKCFKILKIEINKIRRKIEERKVKKIFNTFRMREALKCPICREKPIITIDE